jgi:F-type H+-transporting ATPase subunit b
MIKMWGRRFRLPIFFGTSEIEQAKAPAPHRLAASALLAIVSPLMAAEGGKPPELSPVWQWLNFGILAGILGWLIAKHGGPLLAARARQIREGLAAGERAKADADARAAAVEAQLANLQQAIVQMKSSAREERDREAARIGRDTEAEFARIQQHALQEIESAGKLARLEVRRYAAKLAIDLAEQKVRARMSAEKQAELLNNFIGEIAGSGARLG